MLRSAIPALRRFAAEGVSCWRRQPSEFRDWMRFRRKRDQRLDALEQYVREYRQYCWPVNSLDDLKLAPFHLLASEGAVHTDKRHTWHMEMLARLCTADERLLLATPFQIVDLNDGVSCDAAITWWTDMTSAAAREWSSSR